MVIHCIVNGMFPRVKMIQLTDWISNDSNQSNKNNAVPPLPAEVLMGHLFVLHFFFADLSKIGLLQQAQ